MLKIWKLSEKLFLSKGRRKKHVPKVVGRSPVRKVGEKSFLQCWKTPKKSVMTGGGGGQVSAHFRKKYFFTPFLRNYVNCVEV